MKVTRIYTGDDGQSHFEDIDVDLEDNGRIGAMSAEVAVSGLIFRRTGGDFAYDWHNAPQRQYVVILDGALEVEVGDGSKRRFSGGDILLAEDTTGQGHVSRTIDGQPRRSLFIKL